MALSSSGRSSDDIDDDDEPRGGSGSSYGDGGSSFGGGLDLYSGLFDFYFWDPEHVARRRAMMRDEPQHFEMSFLEVCCGSERATRGTRVLLAGGRVGPACCALR